jgi:hypothetical protein
MRNPAQYQEQSTSIVVFFSMRSIAPIAQLWRKCEVKTLANRPDNTR